MQSPRETRTNAADSAPGVDDGPVRGKGAPVDSRPGGRKAVWILVALSLLVLIGVFVARPRDTGPGETMVATGGTRGEIAESRVPGTRNESAPARP
jgi:hypothetical protein